MPAAPPNHYATLGLDPSCTDDQIRAAYRLLAKQQHPDVNGGSRDAVTRTQALNAAYEVLSDPDRRRDYDRELAARTKPATRSGRSKLHLTQEVHLRIEELLRGTTLQVSVTDFAHPAGAETCELIVPPETAPGTRFRLPLTNGGCIQVRVKVRPDFRFRVRGSDLRCDLNISSQRAWQGGTETIRGAAGGLLRVIIPQKVTRDEIIRLSGEGLPRARGGRGDLLVRVRYRPDVRIRRPNPR